MRHIATQKGANAIFLFIAELNGFRNGTKVDKLSYGQQCYLKSTLHQLDLTDEEDRKDLHENIWLERLYNELDQYFQLGTDTTINIQKNLVLKGLRTIDDLMANPATDFQWSVPIELDASALTISAY